MPFEIKRVGGEGEAGQERALGNGHPPWAGEKLRKTSMVQCSEARVAGLDGAAKMSKTLDNYIAINETPEEIWKKLSTAVTDPARKRRTDPGTPEACNIFSLHAFFSTPAQRARVAEGCRTAGIGCLECKRLLAENIARELAPIRERYEALRNDPAAVRRVLDEGAERCRTIARETMRDVKGRMGLLR